MSCSGQYVLSPEELLHSPFQILLANSVLVGRGIQEAFHQALAVQQTYLTEAPLFLLQWEGAFHRQYTAAHPRPDKRKELPLRF